MKERINERNFSPIEFFRNLIKSEPVELSQEEEIDMSELSQEEKKQLTKTLKEISKLENQFNVGPVRHSNKTVQNISNSRTGKNISNSRAEKNITAERERE